MVPRGGPCALVSFSAVSESLGKAKSSMTSTSLGNSTLLSVYLYVTLY